MTIDIIKLKALATAAATNQYDSVALNDYGTALPPATVLGLIAEIERHRLIDAEGCKPETNILLSGMPCAGAATCRSLNKAEGCKPDHINPPHQRAEALREDIERGNRIQLAMALDLTAIAQALGIPPEEQEGGAAESIAIIRELQDRLWNRDALLSDLLDHDISIKARERIHQAMSSEKDPCSLSTAVLHVLAERRDHIVKEGWTPEHDDAHVSGEIAQAAADYAMPGQHPVPGVGWASKKAELPRRLQLIRAGALILAELERLDRMSRLGGRHA
ncbi:hypothetical protein [Pseudomonas putida]|uniref:hypothetical protein n=1 Tax=Pseudomonas putida TaxID=303 RepID=UPI0018D7958E|nr:hypothetical protein [Pseudomonas putida]MBH3349794.1 hypothetical protein [Pseudomonas putida]